MDELGSDTITGVRRNKTAGYIWRSLANSSSYSSVQIFMLLKILHNLISRKGIFTANSFLYVEDMSFQMSAFTCPYREQPCLGKKLKLFLAIPSSHLARWVVFSLHSF